MKLIAESGTSKAEWCLLEGNHIIEHEYTEGINPLFQTRREISRCIRLQLPDKFFNRKIDEIFFYGAGCISEEKKNIVKASLISQFRAHAHIHTDLLAVARSLFGREKGIACILDSGSNSGFYDGHDIIKNVRSLGCVLGDEGSGAALGKMFLSDCLRNLAPAEITERFYEFYQITPDDVIDAIYNKPYPDYSLSLFSYFLTNYTDNEYVHKLIYKNFRNFFKINILQYDYQNYPIGFVGAVGDAYKEILNEVAREFDVEISQITESPMKGLIDYYIPKIF